ncbi:hypothetical protein EG328_002267 [Venturia inaequalis]|uniref:Uncharacterized protein n=1 Tax=Venturia inaequalis TaxID=5025 RepID=A0A8H3UUW8_VENIN|nr:hypothetical protein EG328_002267 [Venturia inaequalis]
MAPPTRPNDNSRSTFLPRDQNNTQSPASRANLPPNPPRRPVQKTAQRQQQQVPVPRSRIQYMPQPSTLAEAYRAHESNYTSKPIDYPLGRHVKVQVAGAPGIHHTHPIIGARFILQADGCVAPRSIAPDMMEAIFLGDPGHFICLDDGARYYLWRRTKLKMQGKSVLTDRLYPNFPPFQFDFTSTFNLPHPQTGRPFRIDHTNRHGTYAYFYYCWKRQEFPEPGAVDADRDSESKAFRRPANAAQIPNTNKPSSLEEFLYRAGFWNEFGPDVCVGSPQGSRLRSAVLKNMIHHMDIAWHELTVHTGKNITLPNGRDDVLAYLEASLPFWSDPTWKRPEGIPQTPTQYKMFHQSTQLFPYILHVDRCVRQREAEIRRGLASREGYIPPAQVQLGLGKRKKSGLQFITLDEVDFMDEFLDYTNCEEGVEEKKDAEMTG